MDDLVINHVRKTVDTKIEELISKVVEKMMFNKDHSATYGRWSLARLPGWDVEVTIKMTKRGK